MEENFRTNMKRVIVLHALEAKDMWTAAMELSSDGNLGIGITPSTAILLQEGRGTSSFLKQRECDALFHQSWILVCG